MSEEAKLKTLVNSRKLVRKSITELAEKVNAYYDTHKDALQWSNDVELKISQWEVKLRRLEGDVGQFNRKMAELLDAMQEDEVEAARESEYTKVAEYSEKLDNTNLKLSILREQYAKSGKAGAASSSQDKLLEAIDKLVQMQTNAVKREIDGNQEVRGTDGGGDLGAVLRSMLELEEARLSGAAQLPVARLRKFGGQKHEFIAFIDEFRRLVHERVGLSKLQKYKLLRDVLEGEAARTISGIHLTEDNYEAALKCIIKRYGCVETIVFEIFTKMLELPKIQKESDEQQMRAMLDKVNNFVITLDSMELDKQFYSCIMYPVLLRTLPESIVRKFLGTIVKKSSSGLEGNDSADGGEEEGGGNMPVNLKICANGNLPKLFNSRFSDLIAFLTDEIATREWTHSLCPKERTAAGTGGSLRTPNKNYTFREQQNQFGNSYSYNTSGGSTVVRTQMQRQQNMAVSNCIFCDGRHPSTKCQVKLPLGEKRGKANYAGVCFKCLERGHRMRECRAGQCSKCSGDHHIMLCPEAGKTTVHTVVGGENLLPTGHVRIHNVSSGSRFIRFLFDTGSQRNFITRRLAKALGVDAVDQEYLYVHVFGGAVPKKATCLPIVNVKIVTRNGEIVDLRAHVIEEITADVLPKPSEKLRALLSSYDYDLAEMVGGAERLELLINSKESMFAMDGRRECIGEDIVVVGTKFGDVVVTGSSGNQKSVMVTVSSAPNLDKFWSLESLGISPKELEQSVNLEEVGEKFKEGIERLADGRYQVKMNLKSNIGMLETNESVAFAQLKGLAQRLNKDQKLKEDYLREINVFFDNDFAEELPVGEVPKFVMAHFPVVQPDKESYKVRPVFNASGSARGKLSLNDCIENTPNLLPCPLKALIGFRRYRVAISGDISKAYLMVKVHPSHRNYLCFLWFENEKEMKGQRVYRMTATSFGVKDSQYNTITVIREHAKKYAEKFPGAVQRVLENFYMDDLLTGADSEEQASNLWEDIRTILNDAGMTMRKFKSSSGEIREKYGDVQEEKSVLLRAAGLSADQELSKVLGVSWDQDADVFTFEPKGMMEFVKKAAPTMRTLMGACARLYDPQGLLAPFTMHLKLVLQEAHLSKLKLDDTLPPELAKRWREWCGGLGELHKFRIPRWFATGTEEESVELHAFSDASDRAYAAVIFLKTVSHTGEMVISLVACKAKLAPLKQLDLLTIPKKELMGAMLATRLVTKVKEYLGLQQCPTFFWTDAQVVLYWIHSECPAKWGVFVKNRLTEILEHTKPEQWGHCPGKDNPADLPSRGVLMKKLNENDLWLAGPSFLRGPPSEYPVFKKDSELKEHAAEINILHVRLEEPIFKIESFSTIGKAVRVYALVKRACRRFKEVRGKVKNGTMGPLSGAELKETKQQLLREAQSRCLEGNKELLAQGTLPKDALISEFKPFIDDNGLVRVGGRLQYTDEPFEVRHPVLLKDDPFTRLLIQEAHEGRMMHMKVDAVMNELREKYWIVRMRQIVKSVIHKCGGCKRDSANLAGAEEAPLPPSRVEMSFKPFKTTGLDYLGPIMVKVETGEKKVWVALFTCAVVRAIHLEVVEDLSATACLSAIRRFVAAHGIPSLIVSDNALAFKKASGSLAALFKSLNDETLQNYCGQRGIEWSFNVARAPWWGGFFERMVGITKTCLRKVMKSQKLSLMNFITIIQEIAAVINQRPLTRMPSEADEPKALSPAQFISPQIPLTLPAGKVVSLGGKPEGLVKIWQQRERMLNAFWKRWRVEYMLVLRGGLRRKSDKGSPLEVGDIVIMKDETPRAFWKLGRVAEILGSRDKVARAYKVHLGGGRYVNRAAKLLAKLL